MNVTRVTQGYNTILYREYQNISRFLPRIWNGTWEYRHSIRIIAIIFRGVQDHQITSFMFSFIIYLSLFLPAST